jgi:hypothetical protein
MIAKGVLAPTLISARASRIGCELFMKPRQLFYVHRVVRGGSVASALGVPPARWRGMVRYAWHTHCELAATINQDGLGSPLFHSHAAAQYSNIVNPCLQHCSRCLDNALRMVR